MGITAEQRRKRMAYLGASDLAGALGLDPTLTPYEVWLEKTGQLVYDDDETAQATIGKAVEPSIIAMLEAVTKLKFVTDPPPEFIRNNFLMAHPDGVAYFPNGAVQATAEVKVVGDSAEWGTSGSQDMPAKVITQCYAQMICSGADRAFVGALLAGKRHHDFRWYTIIRDHALSEKLLTRAWEFWDRHVVGNVPPPIEMTPSMHVLSRVIRHGGPRVPMDPNLYSMALLKREVAKKAQQEADEALARLVASLGASTGGTCELGDFAYTMENAGDRIDTARLRKEHPAIFADLAKKTTRMMPRFYPAKGSK